MSGPRERAHRRAMAAMAAAVLLSTCLGCSRSESGSLAAERSDGGGDFRLIDQNGRPFELARERGKVVLLYFGYTLCPDACPTMLSKLVRVYQLLGKDASRVETVFVSVDPQRDKPAKLKEYLGYFAIPAVGLTGPKEQIDRAVHRYGARYQITDSGSAAGPLVDHSTSLYLIDPKGDLRHTFQHDERPEVIAAEVGKYLR
jgi:protein SCO1/2